MINLHFRKLIIFFNLEKKSFYNNYKCLKSILEQNKNFFSYNIIFIDDGSTDNSLAIAKVKLKNNRNSKIIINKKNIGLSKSCNKAIKACTTKYFIRVDSDDYVSKNFIHFFEKKIKNNKDFIFWEEYDLYIRYLKNNLDEIVKINQYLYFYRRHKASMSYKKNWIKKAWNQLEQKYGQKKLLLYRTVS